MVSLDLSLKYFKGTKKILFLSFISFIILLIFIQGVFVYSFQVQEKEKNLAINHSSGDALIDLSLNARTSSQRINLLSNVTSFASSLVSEEIDWVGFFIKSQCFLFSDYYDLLFLDEILINTLLNHSFGEHEMLISKQFAILNNLSINNELQIYGLNYTVDALLTYSEFDSIDAFLNRDSYLSGVSHRFSLEDIIILNINSLTDPYFNETLYGGTVSVRYNSEILQKNNPARSLRLSKQLDQKVANQLWRLIAVSKGYDVDFRLTEDFAIVQEQVLFVMSFYLLISIPLIIASLVFFIIILKSNRDIWKQYVKQLWIKGFSRKKSYYLMLQVFFIADLLVVITFISLLLLEAIIFGMLIDFSFLLIVLDLMLMLLILIIIQARELYFLCFPKEEYLSLLVTGQKDFQKKINYLDSKPKLSIKRITFFCITASVGAILINYTNIIFWLQEKISMNSFFALYGSNRVSVYRISSWIAWVGFLLLSITVIWAVLSTISFIGEKTSNLILFRRNLKSKRGLYTAVFKMNLFKRKNIGLVLFLMFFSFGITFMSINSYITESIFRSNTSEVYGFGDVAIVTIGNENYPMLNETLNSIINSPEIESYTLIYYDEVNLTINNQIETLNLRIIDPYSFPQFLEKTGIYNLLEYQQMDDVFNKMKMYPNSFVIDSGTFSKYSLALENNLTIEGAIDSTPFSINGTLAAVSKFDITRPRGGVYPYVLASFEAFSIPLSLNSTTFIYLEIGENANSKEFLQRIYNDFSIPINMFSIAIEKDPFGVENSMIFIQIYSYITILLATIPLILDLFYSNMTTLSLLHSKGHSIKQSLRILVYQLWLFWLNYAMVGITTSFAIFALLRNYIPYMFFGDYYAIHYDLTTILIIILSSLGCFIIVIALSIGVIYGPNLRNKILETATKPDMKI
ncbi:MAG: hypothetical protein ACTSVO_05290 [Candidatus Heimdallarchaeaceae archaeon]